MTNKINLVGRCIIEYDGCSVKVNPSNDRIFHVIPQGEYFVNIVLPIVDIHFSWFSTAGRDSGIPPDWKGYRKIKPNIDLPLVSFYNSNGVNRCTLALSDSTNPVDMEYGVSEEMKEIIIKISRQSSREFSLYLDFSKTPFYRAVMNASTWMHSFYRILGVPSRALSPVYSTWYSMHQNVSDREVEEEARLAKEIGFESIILDDGWQTLDNSRGYRFTGDWEFEIKKFPDPAGHVKRVREMGLNYVIWMALPFIGLGSKAIQKFSNSLLRIDERAGTGIIDPENMPAVEHISGRVRYIMDLGFDGIKADFIDSITDPEERSEKYTSIINFLEKTLEPTRGKLIEFRQRYISPSMLQFATMVRSFDCPGDPVENWIRIINTRLISGKIPVHSDPLMWNNDETPENVVFNIASVLFAVPQVSVKLVNEKPENIEVLRKWLGFWKENKEVLMDGNFEAGHPEINFATASSKLGSRRITVYRSLTIVDIGHDEELIVNASHEPLLVKCQDERDCIIRDFIFEETGMVRIHRGINIVDVPFCGQLYIPINGV